MWLSTPLKKCLAASNFRAERRVLGSPKEIARSLFAASKLIARIISAVSSSVSYLPVLSFLLQDLEGVLKVHIIACGPAPASRGLGLAWLIGLLVIHPANLLIYQCRHCSCMCES